MKYSNNVINILTAKTYKGIGRAWIVKNIKGNESIEAIISLLNKDAKLDYPITIDDFINNSRTIKDKIEKLEEFIEGAVAIGDDNFPQHRGKVKNSEQPIVLFYKGDISLLEISNNNIAVIGLLEPDYDTEIIERKVVAELTKNNITIVSGLALGCDTIAHKQALDSNGKTVAILPSPLSNIVPAINKELANKIIENNGLLITEYYEDAKSKRESVGRYQERDRLQALFSDSIILSASYAKNDFGNDSGSRLAMEYALNYSIPRAVIYDEPININNPKYDLNRQLIQEEEGIIIINSNNLYSSLENITTAKPILNNHPTYQKNLFDFG